MIFHIPEYLKTTTKIRSKKFWLFYQLKYLKNHQIQNKNCIRWNIARLTNFYFDNIVLTKVNF